MLPSKTKLWTAKRETVAPKKQMRKQEVPDAKTSVSAARNCLAVQLACLLFKFTD
jgi:hypothetical protein